MGCGAAFIMNRKMRRAGKAGAGGPAPIAPPAAAGMLPLALARLREGRLGESEALCRTILARQPDHPAALHCLGLVALKSGDFARAVERIGRASALQPTDVAALVNLGIALRHAGRPAEAVTAFRSALALAPARGDILYNLGNALFDQRDFAGAAGSYRQALAAGARTAEVHGNLGRALEETGAYAAAVASYERAIAIMPGFAEAHSNMGNALMSLGRCAEAIAAHRRALELKPDYAEAHTNLIFALNFDPSATIAEHQRERARWYEMHARRFAAAIAPHPNTRDPERRLRIGYVSGHFRHQAASYAFAPVIIGHDRMRFETFCYSDTVLADGLTERLRGSVGGWRDIVGLPDERVAAMIREDRIDILVDLVGHMSGHRLLAFARKPAPVQVSGWGEPTGTGLATMDHLLADPVLVPADWRPLLAERVIDLPCFLGYWTPEPLPEPGLLPALANGHVTFGSFNRLAKTSDAVLRCWAAILRAVPASRLLLKYAGGDDPVERTRMRSLFAAEGIAADRLELLGNSGREEHFAAYRKVDVALDPFPHGGGMTTLDAAWMGIPTITAPGETISSRLAASCMTALGLADFVAADREDYVTLATVKASDIDALANLRQSLRQMIATSPIGDSVAYTRAVEDAYRRVWREWCAQPRGDERK